MNRSALIVCLLTSGISAAVAQGVTPATKPATPPAAAAAAPPPGAAIPLPPKPAGPMVLLLRGLDKITGRPTDIVAPANKPVRFATLTITARYCYSTPPSETPETAAFVQIDDHRPDQSQRRVFSGWMYASSPGLNGMEHPLYDVWAISCNTNAPGMAPTSTIASTNAAKVLSPDSSDKEGVDVVPVQ